MLSGSLIPDQSVASLATPTAPATAARVPITVGAAETTSDNMGDTKPIFCFMDGFVSGAGVDSWLEDDHFKISSSLGL